jgi:hypothetical protein
MVTRELIQMIKRNYSDMKKIALGLIMISLLVGCYDEFRIDYPYTTVAFSSVKGNSTDDGVLGRTVVKNEGLKIDFGVYLSGVLENTEERWVKFVIDPSLLAGTTYELMPSDYYTLSHNNTFTIPKGSYIGRITVTLDSAKFIGDPKSLGKNYVIPFRLTETSADSILSTQSTKLFQISYINHYEGYYDQTGTFETREGATVLNSGAIKNVINQKTVALDSTMADGMIWIGANYAVKYGVRADNSVYLKKMPISILPPANQSSAAVITAPGVSSWENANAIRNGIEPTSSTDKTGGAYGNWNSANIERYVEYRWASPYLLNKSEIYWWTDGGGILPPTSSRLEYWNLTTLAWELVPNHNGFGNLLNQYNVTTFDEILTTAIRVYMINTVQSCGILEWKIWGVMAAVTPEQGYISDVTPEGACTFDQATSTYNLNYRINYIDETYYTIVNTKLVWRNRIRDGVNEWRR